jgi:hypothetical protein
MITAAMATDRDGGRSDDHVPVPSGRLLVKTTRRRAQR